MAAPQTAEEVRMLALQEKERREREREAATQSAPSSVRRLSEGNA